MDSKEFREFAKAAIDYIADYMDNIRDRNVLPSVEPGYLKDMIPDSVPEEPESWKDLLSDIDKVIMPGMTHWSSPQFHAYYPTGNSFASIVGEIIANGLGGVGFSWIANPACTELEVEMMNWLGKLIDLPKEFLNSSDGPGGGIIQGSASEATFVALLAAKERKINHMKDENPNLDVPLAKTKLISYTSDQSNSSVEKAGLLASIPMRLLPVDEKCRLRGETLEKAIKEDISKGFIPCYLCINWGTTGTCAFDPADELGPICEKYDIWLHIDAAYAGASFICPEYRHLMKGVEYADSFDFNMHKWLLVNFDCSTMWVKNANYLIDAFDVQRIYLKDNDTCGKIPDYRHWQISLGRRFRSIKLWTVLRLYGASGLRNHIRKQIGLADYFAEKVNGDSRFEIITEVSMGLVCFRIKGDNELTKTLLDKLVERKKIYVVPCFYRGKMLIRFCICSRFTEKHDVDLSWNEIETMTTAVLKSNVETKLCEEINEKLNTSDKCDASKQLIINNLKDSAEIQEKSK